MCNVLVHVLAMIPERKALSLGEVLTEMSFVGANKKGREKR